MLANLGSVPVSVEIKMASPPFSEKKNSLGKSENEDYAMKKPTTITSGLVREYRGFIELRLRRRVPEAIELVMEEEVAQALGCPAWERTEERRGYRNGAEIRRATTSVRTRELRVPRASCPKPQTNSRPACRGRFG